MVIQKTICSLDPSTDAVLCIVAFHGPDGHALPGFCRSLRKEYRRWSIYCVVFSSVASKQECETLAQQLCIHPLAEPEMLVDADGSIHASRVDLSSPPRSSMAFHAQSPWTYQKNILSQVVTPSVPPSHAMVSITHLSSDISSYRTFVGRVDGSSNIYIGITHGSILSNYVVAHRDSLLELPKTSEYKMGHHALPGIIAVLAVGIPRICNPLRLDGGAQILVTDTDMHMGRSICQVYDALGLNVLRLPSDATISEIKKALHRKPRFIISGCRVFQKSSLNCVASWTRSETLFEWAEPMNKIQRILSEDPWLIGDALKLTYLGTEPGDTVFTAPYQLLIEKNPEPIPEACSAMGALFDKEKSYVLFGGMGGIGVYVAYWMYQVWGAAPSMSDMHSYSHSRRAVHGKSFLLPGLGQLVLFAGLSGPLFASYGTSAPWTI